MKRLPLPPCAELTTGEVVRQVLKWQVLGLALLFMHVALCKINILLFFPLALLVLGFLYHKAPLTGLLVFFQILIYENWVISILSPGMDHSSFTALQGTGFAALVLMSGISFTRLTSLRRWRHLNGRLMTAVKVALSVTVLYAVYGLAGADATSVAIYFREATSLVLAVPIGLDVGRVWGFRTIGVSFIASAALSIVISLVEIAAPAPYYDAVNAPNYMNLKYADLAPSRTDYTYFSSGKELAEDNTDVFLNITASQSNDTSFRFMGTIIHPISYAYVLAGVSIVALSLGMAQWLWVTVPLLALVGVKGALLLLFCTIDLWFIWYVTKNQRLLLLSGLVMVVGYVGFGLWIGLNNGDYHVIGFMGGLHGLLTDPIGHGLGVGGNFSAEGLAKVHWNQAEQFGMGFALESAVGVLIYQMGAAAAVIFAVIGLLLNEAGLRGRAPMRRDIVFLALATVAVNGIFQEEAYTSYACGLFTLLCAVVVANGQRATASYAPKVVRPQQPAAREALA